MSNRVAVTIRVEWDGYFRGFEDGYDAAEEGLCEPDPELVPVGAPERSIYLRGFKNGQVFTTTSTSEHERSIHDGNYARNRRPDPR